MSKLIEIEENKLAILIQQNKEMKSIINDFYKVYTTIAPMVPLNNDNVDIMGVALKLPKIIRQLKNDPIFLRVFSKEYEAKLNKYAIA